MRILSHTIETHQEYEVEKALNDMLRRNEISEDDVINVKLEYYNTTFYESMISSKTEITVICKGAWS